MNRSTKKDDRQHFCSSQLPLFQHPIRTTHTFKQKPADTAPNYFSEVILLSEKNSKTATVQQSRLSDKEKKRSDQEIMTISGSGTSQELEFKCVEIREGKLSVMIFACK